MLTLEGKLGFMIRAVVFAPGEAVARELEHSILATPGMSMVRHERRYLQSYELDRCIRASSPQVVYVSLADPGSAITLIREVLELVPGVQVVAIDTVLEPTKLLRAMNLGVREFLTSPWDIGVFQASIQRLQKLLDTVPVQTHGTDQVITFLPAKAGVGTSTVALNTSAALAALQGQQVLLADLDLSNGLLGFMLKQDSGYSISEAVAHSDDLDEHNWGQVIASRGKMDLLLAGRADAGQRIEPSKIVKLITFARRLYTTLCLDVSGNMERYTIEVMKESKHIFLVCTPEIPAIHLAQKKIEILREMDVLDRVQVVLNRMQKDQVMKSAQISKILRVPVAMELPNDYKGVHGALTKGETVREKTQLGLKFSEFAKKIIAPEVGVSGNPNDSKNRKFLEMFSVARGGVSA